MGYKPWKEMTLLERATAKSQDRNHYTQDWEEVIIALNERERMKRALEFILKNASKPSIWYAAIAKDALEGK